MVHISSIHLFPALLLLKAVEALAGGWVVDQGGGTQLDTDAWPLRDWTQVMENGNKRKGSSKWASLGQLSSPEVFEEIRDNEEENIEDVIDSSDDIKNNYSKRKSSKKIEHDLSGKSKNIFANNKLINKFTTSNSPQRKKPGPGMGGSALSSVVRSVKEQKFATEPAPQTAVVGTIVVMPCRVINKVGRLQWTKDGFGLGTDRPLVGYDRYSMIGADDEGDYSLRIQPVLLEDDGMFQCQVTASAGVPDIRSKTVRLNVYVPPDPPQVTPKIVNSTAGMVSSITCVSKGGRPPPEIHWVDDTHPRQPLGLDASTSVEIMEDGKRSIVTSILSFTPRRTHDNTSIACMTSHQALTSPLTSNVDLHIKYPPEVQINVHPDKLVEGDNATFTCTAVANPPALVFRWYHNGMLVINESSATFTLRKVTREMNRDTVTCEVSNKVGGSKKTQSLSVRYGPKFKTPPEDVAAELQKEVLLKCNVNSNPAAAIVWIQEGSDKIIGTGSELRVVVTSSSTGAYKCIATVRERDLQFPELVGRMKVLLKGPPVIVSPSTQLGRPGSTVRLECNTESVPSPIRVTWTYKGRALDLDDPHYEVQEQAREGGLRTVLVIHEAVQTDFGDYNCSVVNEFGIDRKLIRLDEEKRIPPVLMYGVSGVLLLAILVILLLVLCSKKTVTRDKSGDHEKPVLVPHTNHSNSGVAQAPNMYSAGSDSRLTDHLTPNSSLARSQDTLGGMEAGNTEREAASRTTRLVEDSIQDLGGMFPSQNLREEESSGFLPLLDVARHDTPVNGVVHRGPSTDSQPANGASKYHTMDLMSSNNNKGISENSNNVLSTSDFCTMRRSGGLKAPPDLTEPFHHNGHLLTSSRANGGLDSHVVSHHLQTSQQQKQLMAGLDRYTSYGGYGASPPPPPPYSRPGGLTGGMTMKQSPMSSSISGLSSSLNHQQHLSDPLSGGNMLCESTGGGVVDNSYIFSPEAMLKPGTLV